MRRSGRKKTSDDPLFRFCLFFFKECCFSLLSSCCAIRSVSKTLKKKRRVRSKKKFVRSFVRSCVCACVTHACVFSCLSCMDADTTALLFFHHDRYFSVLRWIHEHCDGTHRGTRVVNGLVESLTKLLCLFSSFKERTKVPKFTISPSLVQNDKTGIRQRTA